MREVSAGRLLLEPGRYADLFPQPGEWGPFLESLRELDTSSLPDKQLRALVRALSVGFQVGLAALLAVRISPAGRRSALAG